MPKYIVKKQIIHFVVFLQVITLFSCAMQIESSGGMGKHISKLSYPQHKTNKLKISRYLKNVRLNIFIKKESDMAPVEPGISYIQGVVNGEILANNGLIESDVDTCDLSVHIIISKFISRKFNEKYKTYIDCSYKLIDPSLDKMMVHTSHSFSGSGSSHFEAFNNALNKFIYLILENDKIIRVCSKKQNPTPSRAGKMADNLSYSLLQDFERQIKTTTVSIAFTGLKNDEGNELNTILQTSLLKYWKPPTYTFYTREYVDKLLDEHEFQYSGLVEDNSVTEVGDYVGAEYIITGKLVSTGKKKLLEIQLIELKTGRIISSKTAYN